MKNLLVRELKLETLSPEAQDKIMLKLGEIINRRIALMVATLVSESLWPQFEVAQKNGGASLTQFLRAHIQDLERHLKSEVIATMNEYKSLTAMPVLA